MTPRELAAAIRRGHTMIRETDLPFLDVDCGCALGAAYVGAGNKAFRVNSLGDDFINQPSEWFSSKLGIPLALARSISGKHYGGMKRLAIADWLDTLEPETKPQDKQSFETFMATVMQPVTVTA